MIDATTFATSYNAFWRMVVPTCDLFVRRVNLDGYERWAAPLKDGGGWGRSGFIAEYAFAAFVLSVDGGAAALNIAIPEGEVSIAALKDAKRRLSPYIKQGLDVETPLWPMEDEYASNLYKQLCSFFFRGGGISVARPQFPGCGYLDASEGDVIHGTTLYEIKAVDRNFRSSDFRQLLTYAALNDGKKKYKIENVGIFNPRRGVFAEFSLEVLSSEVSGLHPSELLSVIRESVSNGAISR